MPVPQLVPPGHLDQHGVLVALTPVLVCLMAALALRVLGDRSGQRGLTAARLLAGLNLLGALVLQGLFLLPWGAAAAYQEALAGGLVRVGWLPSGAACALGLWACWYWSPLRASAAGTSATRWCLRVALALALPVVAVPALVIAALADDPRASGRRCHLVAALAVALSALLLLPALHAGIACLHAMALLAALGVLVGPWRWASLVALSALLLSW